MCVCVHGKHVGLEVVCMVDAMHLFLFVLFFCFLFLLDGGQKSGNTLEGRLPLAASGILKKKIRFTFNGLVGRF